MRVHEIHTRLPGSPKEYIANQYFFFKNTCDKAVFVHSKTEFYNALWLFYLLTGPPQQVCIAGATGQIDSIQREDGSGKNFNVTVNTSTGPKTVFVKTF